MANYIVAHFDDIDTIRCPCGFVRRAFAQPDNAASVHILDIQHDSKVHYHKEHTEIYLVLEGRGQIELDGAVFPLRPFSTVLIEPLCRHRAVNDPSAGPAGALRLVNICLPPFDPADEWFD